MFNSIKKLFGKDSPRDNLSSELQETVDHIAADIIRATPNRQAAYQHIMEELDAASMGDDTAQRFADKSGISSEEYSGTMQNTPYEIQDEVENMEGMLRGGLMGKVSSREELRDASLAVVDKLMSHWKIGKK